jgi:16S rRNA (adenine1518-N6/adenine1519-N6)-dimethyltransferase
VTSVRALVAQHNILIRKKLGQAFLEDIKTIKKIVSIAAPKADETIVEIGAGLGSVTEELAKTAGRVIALEIDRRLLDVLRERFSTQHHVEIVDRDVLKYDFTEADKDRKIKVVGNIPYYISSPILFRLLSFRRNISFFLLMFQKELAERITAGPGTKQYGIPSVMVAKYTDASCEMVVSPQCFYPPPDVASCVVRMTVKPVFNDPYETSFEKVVRAAFAHRRKNIMNNLLYMGFSKDILDAVFLQTGIIPERRAETLTVEEFSRLSVLLGGIENKNLDK